MLVETISGYLVETDEDNYKEKAIPKEIDKKLEKVFEKYSEEPDELIKELKKVIEKNPDQIDPYRALDMVYILNGMEEESVKLIKESYEKFPDNTDAKISYMADLARDKQFDKIKEICGDISIENIAGKKESYDLPEFALTSEILIRYFMHSGDENKAKEYYNELKRFECDTTGIKHDLFPEFIDSLKEGDSVKVKDYTNEEGINLTGWEGRIAEIDLTDEEVLVEWDSITIKNLTFEKIKEYDEKGLMWYAEYIPTEYIELSTPRDTEEEAEALFDEISDKIDEEYKVPGFPYELYEEITKLEVRTGRILTDILSTMQEIRKTFSRYNLNKLSEFVDLPLNEVLKHIDILEEKGIIKTFYSSVLKKDRERWIFLKTDKNLDIHAKVINKEISPKELEKLFEEVLK